MASLLILYVNLISIISAPRPMHIPIVHAEPIDATQITTIEVISFDALIVDIELALEQIERHNHNIYKIYKHVFGPFAEMSGIDIGELVIEFYYQPPKMNICKYEQGRQYLGINVNIADKTAIIQWIDNIPNGLDKKLLLRFSNAILYQLGIDFIGQSLNPSPISTFRDGLSSFPIVNAHPIHNDDPWILIDDAVQSFKIS